MEIYTSTFPRSTRDALSWFILHTYTPVVSMAVTTATALALAPLAFPAGRLIAKIIHEAEKSSQNKEECRHLAGRLSSIDKLLPRLQQQAPGAAEVLARLSDTLNDAHELVVACQKWSGRRKFSRTGLAERFRLVNSRIDSHLIDITAFCQVDRKGCRDGSSVPLPLPATASRSLTVATTARYGHRMRKRDAIKSTARMLIGVIFHKPEYVAKGASAFLR